MIEPYSAIEALNRDIDRLMEDRDAALKRAEAAEAMAKRNASEAEAPAAPRVLPEHLAWIEACAEHFAEGYNHPVNGLMPRMVAARALVAAVARRDGGGK